MPSTWTEIAHAEALAMPDLSELEDAGRLNFSLAGFRNYLTGMGVPYVEGSHAQAHYKNFVRLVDTAVRRYESARYFLQQMIDRPADRDAVPEVVRALSELESMFNVLHRALVLLDQLKRAREVPVSKDDLRPFDDFAVRQIRDASEHIADYLSRGDIGKNDDVMVRAWAEGITFVGKRISFVQVAMWLERLHEIARRLVDHDPFADQRPTIPDLHEVADRTQGQAKHDEPEPE
jgi:hypothetical protein